MVFRTFHTWDYVVFAASLAISVLIGVGFMVSDWRKRRRKAEDFLMGGGKINPIAVGFSMIASLINGTYLLGVPAEIHYHTTTYALVAVGIMGVGAISAHIFVPLYRRIPVISCYEYLEMRFHARIVRVAAALVFTVAVILFLAVVLYAPAAAVMQVTGLDKTITIIVCGLVCLLYVLMGGMRAVIWTDFVQVFIMLAGLLTLTIKGTLDAGGGWHVYQYANNNSRINFNIWDLDPRIRHTVWTQVVGFIFIFGPLFGSNQMIVQRYHAVRNVTHAQISVYASMVVGVLLTGLLTMLGLVMYDYYSEADPLLCGHIERGDQLVPYFLMEILGDYHGIPGLFIASVFAAALSSVSSALNSLAAVVLEDFMRPIARSCFGKDSFTHREGMWITRCLALFFGVLTIGLSFSAEHMGPLIVQIPATIWGTVESPLYGLFVLANFFPCANAWGAMAGLIVSLVVNFWQVIGSLLYKPRSMPTFPLGTQCDVNVSTLAEPNNITSSSSMTSNVSTATMGASTTAAVVQPVITAHTHTGEWLLLMFYEMSYVWLGLLGLVVCLVVGLLVSAITNCITGRDYRSEGLDPELLWPCADKCCCCCPPTCKDALRCGINFDQEQEKEYSEVSRIDNDGCKS